MPSVPKRNVTVEVNYRLVVKLNSGLSAISTTGSQFLPLSYGILREQLVLARGADYACSDSGNRSRAHICRQRSESGGAFDSTVNVRRSSRPDLGRLNAEGSRHISLRGRAEIENGGTTPYDSSEAKGFVQSVLGNVGKASPIRLVSVRRGAGFSGGGTIFFDEAALRRPKIDAQTALFVAEGVAKTWLGGSTAVSGDGSGAIREGLARFLATQFIESKYGKDVADVERLRQRVAYASVVQRDAPISTVSPLDDYYYTVVANKGAMVGVLFLKRQSEFSSRFKQLWKMRVTWQRSRTAFDNHKAFLDTHLIKPLI